MPMLPWPVCPLAAQARLGQHVRRGPGDFSSPGVAGQRAKQE